MFLMWIHGEDGHPLPASNEAELRKQLDENGISGGLMDAVVCTVGGRRRCHGGRASDESIFLRQSGMIFGEFCQAIFI
jgi:hypothetical protein